MKFRQLFGNSMRNRSAEVALIENIQREDLNAIEEAEAYRQLIGRYGHSQEVVGKLVGKSRSHVANLLRLARPARFGALNAAARRYQHGPCPGDRDGARSRGAGQ